MWVCAHAASSKGTDSTVPAWFRADSGMNLIKQGENVTGRSCGSLAQCSHSKRETLGSSPGRASFFFHHCDNTPFNTPHFNVIRHGCTWGILFNFYSCKNVTFNCAISN